MSNRLGLATDFAALLFIPAFAAGVVFVLRVGGEEPLLRVAVAAAVPAGASLLFALLAAVFPSLIARSGQSAHLVLMLPLVYVALLVAAVFIALATGNPLVRIPEPLNTAIVWLDPKLLIATVIAQALVLQGRLMLKASR
jgi:hypothetical protein